MEVGEVWSGGAMRGGVVPGVARQGNDLTREHMTTTEAARIAGITATYVRVLIARGVIRATKEGRDWCVDEKSARRFKRTRRSRNG